MADYLSEDTDGFLCRSEPKSESHRLNPTTKSIQRTEIHNTTTHIEISKHFMICAHSPSEITITLKTDICTNQDVHLLNTAAKNVPGSVIVFNQHVLCLLAKANNQFKIKYSASPETKF